MPSFIHAADLHLDSPLRGLSRYEGAPVEALRGATREALSGLVDVAIRREVDLLVIAGDIYDGDWTDYNTGLFFSRQMARLNRVGIPVVMISGNHDAASVISRDLSLPGNVTQLSSKRAQTKDFPELGLAVHGQSFATQVVTEDLTQSYPVPRPGRFNIGLLHTSADGRPDHDTYAPCTVESLKLLGYDYWALGHIHQREVLCQDPWIVFSGNLQGRHARELGPKGATLVTLQHNRVDSVESLVLDAVRWNKLEFCCDGFESNEEMRLAFRQSLVEVQEDSEGRLLALRVEMSGSGGFYTELLGQQDSWKHQILALSGEFDAPGIWIEKVKWRPLPEAEAADAFENFAEFLPGIRDFANRPGDLEALGQELFLDLEKKLPLAWREGIDGLRPTDPAQLESSLQEAKQYLMSLLSATSGDES